jgi:hypothetical protein
VKEALLEAREEKEVLLEVLLEAIEEKEVLLEAREEKEVLLEVLLEAIEEKEVLLEAKEVIILKPHWTPEILGKDQPLLQEATPLLEVIPLQEATPPLEVTPLQEVIDPPVFMPQPGWQSGSPQEATPLQGVGVILPLEVMPQQGVIHLLHLPNILMQIASQVP